MRNILVLIAGLLVICACKSKKLDAIQPEIPVINLDIKIVSDFKFARKQIDFTLDSNWLTAKFKEKVKWEITIVGLQSGAQIKFSGNSDSLGGLNTAWHGGNSSTAFFKAGEQAVAILNAPGYAKKDADTCTIAKVKNNFGPNVIVWWDMDALGVAKQGTAYWFEYWDGPNNAEKVLNVIRNTANPIQGNYRSVIGNDSASQTTTNYIGGISHTPIPAPFVGFSNSSTSDIYVNFYVRKTTKTAAIAVALQADVSGATSELGKAVEITWEGWQLVSIKLSDMDLSGPSFDPSRLKQFVMNPRPVSYGEAGFDIDFICLTKGKPFDQLNK